MYSRLLLQKRDYKSLEIFVIKSYDEFEIDKLFDRSNHNDKLTILTYIANCLFKTNKNNQSLKYAEMLLNSMLEYDSLLYNKYLFFYYNINNLFPGNLFLLKLNYLILKLIFKLYSQIYWIRFRQVKKKVIRI